MNTFGLAPAFVIDEDVLTDAVREVFAAVPDAEIDEAAAPRQMLAIADAYARRMREKIAGMVL